MYKAKVNKASNQDRILECLYRHPGISRKDISDITAITPATVTTTVAAMCKEGLILELGQIEEDRGTIGRSRIALGINAAYGYTVGVEFTFTSLTTCAADMAGKLLYSASIPYSPAVGEAITDLVVESIQRCLDCLALPQNKLLGIGIGVPGHMDVEEHYLVTTNEKWRDFDGQKIRQAFSCPVVFENNIRCMAARQYLHHGEHTPSTFALFHVGRGMYCANVTEDGLYIGTTYGSGEIGHTIAVRGGKRCECGKRGCLETVASETALLEKAGMLYQIDENTILRSLAPSAQQLTIEHIARAYALGEPSIRQIMMQALEYLCIATLNVAVLMNPGTIFLHGRLFNCQEIQEDFLEMVKKEFDFTGNNYRLGSVGFLRSEPTDGALGSAALAILKCVIHAFA